MSFTLLPEENYAQILSEEVLPALEPFHQSGTVEAEKGRPIRWDWYGCEAPRGSILISHGFTESGYKFIEMVWYFHQMGFAVCTVDHRGHGFSWRINADNPSLTHAEHFSDYVEDLQKVVAEVLLPKGSAPYILYSHSMGGAIAAQYLKAHPGVFSAALFNAPMIRAATAGLPLPVTGGIAKAACLFGQSKKMVFVHKLYDPQESFEESAATSRARFDWYAGVRKELPRYQNSGASYAWLRETVKVCTELTGRDGAKGIDIPTIFFCAVRDTFVDADAIRAFSAKIPHSICVTIPNSRHEIYRSGNDAMEIYLRSIESFLDAVTEK
jgi:lysophospholipase